MRMGRMSGSFGGLAIGALSLCVGSCAALADTIVLSPANDTTIFNADARSNGAGPFLWCGRTRASGNNTVSRSLVRFDLSVIPAGATITDARMSMMLESGASGSGTQTHTLHRLTSDWGEGPTVSFQGSGAAALPGDATWQVRKYPNNPWMTPGGDFVATPSATLGIPTSTGRSTFSGTGMIADANLWLTSPNTNNGWIIRGNEVSIGTARRFASREISVPASRPQLTITFTPPAACIADINQSGSVTVDDVFVFLQLWFGECAGQAGEPCLGRSADVDGVSGISPGDVFAFLAAWFGGCP